MSETGHARNYVCRLDETALEQVMRAVVDFARAEQLDAAMTAKLHLVLEELATNAMTHGGQCRGQILDLALSRSGAEVIISYRDRAPPFTPPEGTVLSRREGDSVGGFGWLLIRGFCRDIRHEPADPGNRLELVLISGRPSRASDWA